MAMTPKNSASGSDIQFEINITPLTDIFLVLLIIFMVTSSAMIEAGARVNLPSAVSTQTEPRGTTITLTLDRGIFINDRQVTEDNLEQALKEALSASPDKIVILRGDRDVLLGVAVNVLSIIKKAGASEIAIAAEAKKKDR